MKLWGWIVSAVLLVLGALALALYKVTQHPALSSGAVQSIEAAHAPAIQAAQVQLQLMLADTAKNADAIAQEQKKIDSIRTDLNFVYNHAGLTSEQIADRFRKLAI